MALIAEYSTSIGNTAGNTTYMGQASSPPPQAESFEESMGGLVRRIQERHANLLTQADANKREVRLIAGLCFGIPPESEDKNPKRPELTRSRAGLCGETLDVLEKMEYDAEGLMMVLNETCKELEYLRRLLFCLDRKA